MGHRPPEAKCVSLPVAHRIIVETVKRALGSMQAHKAFQPDLSATVELTFYRSDMADPMASRPGVKSVNSRTIQRTVESLADIKGW